MNRKLILFATMILLSTPGAAQKSDMQQFYSLFTEVEFDVLQVYSTARRPAIYPVTSLYPFKGVPVDTSLYHLLKGSIGYIDSDQEITSCFATFRFHITAELEALLLRQFHEGGQEHHIHYLIFNNQKQEIVKDVRLSYAYGYEGSEGQMESWIMDLNLDGQKDIITRIHSRTSVGSEAITSIKDSVVVLVWKDNELVEVGLADTLLKKQLEGDLLYHNWSYLNYNTKENLSTYLKKEGIEVPEYYKTEWCIIAGSDKDIESAKYEIKRGRALVADDQKYGLDHCWFEIYKKGERYYTVLSRFNTKTEAEIALREIKSRFNKTAYVVDYRKWCKESNWQDGILECID